MVMKIIIKKLATTKAIAELINTPTIVLLRFLSASHPAAKPPITIPIPQIAKAIGTIWILTCVYSVKIGLTVMGLGGALQTRLMDVAGDAQTLAASLNHSAFNMANALGAFLGGWVLSHQMGWIAPIWVGFVLSLGGLVILLIAFAVEKASKKA